MRTASVYTFTCECGAHLESPSTNVICPHCGLFIQLAWRNDDMGGHSAILAGFFALYLREAGLSRERIEREVRRKYPNAGGK